MTGAEVASLGIEEGTMIETANGKWLVIRIDQMVLVDMCEIRLQKIWE